MLESPSWLKRRDRAGLKLCPPELPLKRWLELQRKTLDSSLLLPVSTEDHVLMEPPVNCSPPTGDTQLSTKPKRQDVGEAGSP